MFSSPTKIILTYAIPFSITDSIPITWQETIASKKLIASDCLIDIKQLLTRSCDDTTCSWIPSLEITESVCEYHQPSYEEYGNCPPHYIESKTNDLCYQEINFQPWENPCLTTGGSSLSFLDLNSSEQHSILQQVLTSNPDRHSKLNIGLPAKSQWPSKQISSEIDYSTEDVELQWLLPGRYGSILKFSNNSASVICNSHKNLCIDMCLSINATHTTADKELIPTIEDCSNLNSVLCVSKRKSLVQKYGCSKSGYFRVGYATSDSLCYSIKVFSQPLDISASSETIVQLSCGGNNIFHIDSLESHIIYRQLALVSKLKKSDRCLFGISSLKKIMKMGDWVDLNYDSVEFTNWDKTMDFNTIFLQDGYLTVNSNGKWRWEENATCIVCVMDEPPTPAELVLRFNTSDSLLTLNVIGQQYLWKDKRSQMGFLCFALVSSNYTEVPVKFSRQENSYLLKYVGTGLYWCSGHLIQSMEFVESKQVYAFGMVFAVYVEYHCEEECSDPLSYTVTFNALLDSMTDDDLMKIENVEYKEYDTGDTDKDLKLMYHVTVSIKDKLLHDNEHNGIGLPDDQLYSYYVLKKLQHLPMDSESAQFDLLSVTSREFCLPNSIISPDVINWKAAKVGETIELTEGCYNFIRTCSRNRSNGAVWEDYVVNFTCNNQSETSLSLVALHNSFRSSKQTPDVVANLTTTLHDATLSANDLFIVSEIFDKISYFLLSDETSLTYDELKDVFDIFNSLMLISEDVAIQSSELNSTNSLLASFDEILIHQTQLTMIRHEQYSGGIAAIKSPLIANFVLDPVVSGVSGIALIDNGTSHGDLLSYSLRYLQPNQSIDSLLQEINLVVASFVPQNLIENWENPQIILTLFFNDILFQSSNKNKSSSDGIIISLTILNSDSKLSGSIPFYYKPNISMSNHQNYKSAQFCGYWSFTSRDGWESTGCVLNELSLQVSDTILCECSHLTHFGNLINTELIFTEIHEKVLNLITLAGCTLSLVGIMGIFLTAIVFTSWRSKSSSKFLLQLSAAIALQMILLIFINSDDDILTTISQNVYGCIAMGAFIHYSILVMFFWMLIVAYLQFIRYVIVFNQIATANFLLKSSVFGWAMPLLPVFLVTAIDPTSYIPSSNVKFCYPSGYGLLFGLCLPIALIVIANIFVFIAVVISLIKGSSKSAACKVNNDKNDAMWSQLRLSVFLFFILGLSWIFAFLSHTSILFSYLFCLSATIQGFVLFFYFVILDPIARNLWTQLFLKICGCKKY